jgi:hypothetical protein
MYKGEWMDGRMMDKSIITSETQHLIAVNFPKQCMLALMVKFV